MAELLNTVRIDFASLRLYGRDREIQRLARVLTETKNSKYPIPRSDGAQLIEIKGYSGCGKSALAQTLRSKVTDLGGYFVLGKYDQEHDLSQPYAIRHALRDLFAALVKDETRVEQLKAFLGMSLSEDDVATLAIVLPDLPNFLEGGSYERRASQCRPEWAFERMKIAIRNFLECVCDPSRPIVIVIDDIQWCDQAGLALLQLMACSTEMDGLILVCSYRDNELTPDHPTAVMLAEVEKTIHPDNLQQISVGNLRNKDIVNLLVDLSSRRSKQIQSLADMLEARTHGNPFFLLQYLRLLEKNELIRRSASSLAWIWSENDILKSLNVTDNVAEFVSHNIRKLPPNTRQALKVASCFGARFDINLVSLAMRGEDVSHAIQLAAQDGLVERIAPSLFKFTHDRIQEAVYDFASPKDREVLHYTIGHMVKQLMDERAVEDAIWIVTDQLNKGRNLIQTTEEKLELARLNLKAAQKAREKSAFYPAADYLNAGISQIAEEARWTEENYSLSLNLFTLLAEMEKCVGHSEKCCDAAREIAFHGRSLEDKIPSWLVQIDILGTEGKIQQAIAKTTDLLNQFGQKFPKNPGKVAIAVEFFKTKVLLRGRSDDDLVNLPLIQDTKKKTIMELLGRITEFAFHAGMIDHVSMAGFCMMKLTLKYGLYSPYVFSIYGGLLGSVAVLGGSITEYQQACRFGALAIRALPRCSDALQCRTMIVATLFSMHLKQPFNHCLDHALEAYKSGMQVGDLNFGFCATAGYLYIYLCAGLPLKPLLKDCKSYSTQMAKYSSPTYYEHTTVLRQFVLNLTGESQRTTELSGDVMNLNEYLRTSQSLVIGHIRIFQLWLAYTFDDIEKAKEASRILWETPRDEDTLLAITFIRRLYQGLTFLWLERATGKRKYRRRARHMISVLEKFVKGGNINALGSFLLLKAEALRNDTHAKPEEVRMAYDKAIASASRGGFTHTGAVAYELASNCFREQKDDELASFYLTKASQRYTEWNAMAKVKQLEAAYPDSSSVELKGDDWKSVGSGNYRGVARFNSRHSVAHYGHGLSHNINSGNSIISDVTLEGYSMRQ